ncbi:hypothetical protein KVV02_003085 [Mortierella alpina]|uniref:Uncharacterized protein n=1 Tax=Mortierella alpina TaxID=64518 RepID=A0A9P8A6Z4_MORAP|nr:hypothetical protein KVV02_003085 [Mortierella alpina]
MSAYFVVFSKIPLPDQVNHTLDTMEREDSDELVYIEKDGTVDEYKSLVRSMPDNLGIFVVYDGRKSKSGEDCLAWYMIDEDECLLSNADSSWYLFREFKFGFSGIGELRQYVDEEGIYVAMAE